MLLCGYTPFQADNQKELARKTKAANVDFHDRFWKNVSDEGIILTLVHTCNPI